MPSPNSSSQNAAVDQAFGRVVRSYRLQAGLSQEAVGLASRSGRTYVSQLERGERGASLKMLFRLAPVLRVRPSEIVDSVERELERASSVANNMLPPR